MKERSILPKTKKNSYRIKPPFYIVTFILSILMISSVVPYYIYSDDFNIGNSINFYKSHVKNGAYNNISFEHQENKSFINQGNALFTEEAMGYTAARFLSKGERSYIAYLITKQAEAYNIDPLLIVALIQVESSFRQNVMSYKGAKGLMQLMPKTAEYINIKADKGIRDLDDIYNLETNIILGVAYLNYLLEKMDGNLEYALIAYNMGPRNLYNAIQSNNIPKVYSNKVQREYNRITKNMNEAKML